MGIFLEYPLDQMIIGAFRRSETRIYSCDNRKYSIIKISNYEARFQFF